MVWSNIDAGRSLDRSKSVIMEDGVLLDLLHTLHRLRTTFRW